MLYRFLAIFLVIFLFNVKINVSSVFAVTTPDFPACTNPAGTLRVEHSQGTHGVAGSSAEYKGKDSVYNVNDTQTLQCLCTEDEEGIQTNWWKISSLTDSEIQTLKNQGWHYVANGALWGLDNVPYMAINREYECGGGTVLGEATQDILGLATTGDKSLFYGTTGIGIGLISLLLGLLLLRRVRRDFVGQKK